MTVSDCLARHETNIVNLANLTLGNLAVSYAALKAGRKPADFVLEVINVIRARDDLAVDDVVAFVVQCFPDSDAGKGLDWISNSGSLPHILSCVYCMRAIKIFDAEDVNLAWAHMAQARYWCGVAVASKGIEEARKQTISETSKEVLVNKARAGGKARDQAYEPIRQFAYELVRSKKPETGWASRAVAVDKLKKEVLDFSNKNGRRLADKNVANLLDNWFSKIPDYENIFNINRKKRID